MRLFRRAAMIAIVPLLICYGQFRGMYNGGNLTIQSADTIRAGSVAGHVLDPGEGRVPNAHIQVERQGSEALVVDSKSNPKGEFALPMLPDGFYWLGISAPGFNLHVWDLQIQRSRGTRNLDAVLSLGI